MLEITSSEVQLSGFSALAGTQRRVGEKLLVVMERSLVVRWAEKSFGLVMHSAARRVLLRVALGLIPWLYSKELQVWLSLAWLFLLSSSSFTFCRFQDN